MINQAIAALVLVIASEFGLPPYFVLAVAIEENNTLNPVAVSPINKNGTFDLGVMQLNSASYGHIAWDNPEVNIRAGCLHIKNLMKEPKINTYWGVAVAYNCGYARFASEPPKESIDYGGRVMKRWRSLEGVDYINPVINKPTH